MGSECYICYQLFPPWMNTSDVCFNKHPICLPCFNKWKQLCMQSEYKTVKCPVCRKILKHYKDTRIQVHNDEGEEYLKHPDRLLEDYNNNKIINAELGEESIEYIQFLYEIIM